jgi:hypothetical protein
MLGDMLRDPDQENANRVMKAVPAMVKPGIKRLEQADNGQ